MANNEDLMQQMNAAAEEAQAELQKSYVQWSARDVGEWWSRWYLKAGHKRLGRILVALAKAEKEKQAKA